MIILEDLILAPRNQLQKVKVMESQLQELRSQMNASESKIEALAKDMNSKFELLTKKLEERQENHHPGIMEEHSLK